MKKFMSSNDFGLAMFQSQTNYADVSTFYGSDRRTGHRWTKGGPSNQVSRMMQLMCALGLTLDDVRLLIASGIGKSGTSVPDKVASIETQLTALRAQEAARLAAEQAAARLAAQQKAKTVKGRAKAARGGKGASNEQRGKPARRAPKASQSTPAVLR